ncbi:MAG: Maf-like protein [Candidatus Polarisedimenticolaceae bacterium]|nr:Maf-like protein [Candidatus Polarisedimenticolaceae bacterium]
MDASPPPIILGSTSPFRRNLLKKLCIDFSTAAPDIDEQALPNESSVELVSRLAFEKSIAVSIHHPNALIIGSDQVASIDQQILGKPGNRENAIDQLLTASGRCVTFYTGLCLLNSFSGRKQVRCETFRVHFRSLERHQIERYIDQEKPYSCAGSFKSEGLGISLFERLEGDDPNSLIGLPLIQLVRMLGNEGIQIP